MRRQAFAVLLALTTCGTARAEQPPPAPLLLHDQLEYADGLLGRVHGPFERFTARQLDGCWDASRNEYGPDPSCATVALRLTRNGRSVSTADFDNAALWDFPWRPGQRMRIRWRCDSTGFYFWRLRYTNDSYGDQLFTVETSGNFRIPRCRPPRRMVVSLAVARDAARSTARSRFTDESVSRVACVPQRGGTRWTCTATHNDLTTECSDRLTLSFFGRDKWGRRLASSSVDRIENVDCRPF